MKNKEIRESYNEAIVVMAELDQIDRDYNLASSRDEVRLLKILAIEKALLDYANKSLQFTDDEDDV